MKFSAQNVDFNSLSFDRLRSRSFAHGASNFGTLALVQRFI